MDDLPTRSTSFPWEFWIDVGGTFTDFYGADGLGRTMVTKTPTTHYDLSVGFMRGIVDARSDVTVAVRPHIAR